MEIRKYGVYQEKGKPDDPGTDKQQPEQKVAQVSADKLSARLWHSGCLSHLSDRDVRIVANLSRRDLRTQPGVLTPGADKKTFRPEGAVEPVPHVCRD